jgi:flagellar motility protein MotE (MotC chaperone)
MPEEMEGLEQEQAAPESESQPQKKPKKKKKKAKLGKFAYLLLFMVILAGVGAGMHIAGAWDARPLMYEAVPRIPWVGKRLAALTGIPEEYTLTIEQRRRLELERWNKRLDDRERDLRQREESLEALSSDLEARAIAVERAEAEMAVKETKPPESPQEEKAYLDMLMKTYQDISPRRAALIMEQLREDLAVKMLAAMPQDARASILGRMEAVIAARLTERLAAGGSR